MPPKSNDDPLLIAVLDLFSNHQSNTLDAVVDELHITEEAALKSLKRLEERGVLIQTRGGTETPVWKPKSAGENLPWLRRTE